MLTYQLDKGAVQPLYVQLYWGIRCDIESGTIASGEKLPSKRALANHLGISVITVEGAYRQLEVEGYIEPHPRRGFFACHVGSSVVPPLRQEASFSTKRRSAPRPERPFPALPKREETGKGNETPRERRNYAHSAAKSAPEAFADFTGTASPAGLFPYDAWARTMRQVLAEQDEARLLSYSDGRGTYQLRRAIAHHLRGFRGMDISPDRVIIGSGAQSLYGLLVQLLGRRQLFAIENPGYPRLARIYRSHDVPLKLVGLDEKGPLVGQLEECGAHVFHCMPSHQFPLGITTTVGRRRELLEWAVGGKDRYLIEDDYDCEFRMTGRPVPPLQAMDCAERVIYTNTFTKTLGAAFRIGYMVLPPHLAQRFQEQLGFYACTVGALEQLTLARFIESGQYERHVNRQRTHFRKVQNALVKALGEQGCQAQEPWAMQLRNVGAGLHFLMEISMEEELLANGEALEVAIARLSREKGAALLPLSDHRLEGLLSTDIGNDAETMAYEADEGNNKNKENCVVPATGAPLSSRKATAAFVMNYAALREEDASQVAAIIVHAITAAWMATKRNS